MTVQTFKLNALDITILDCPRCGLLYGITEAFEKRRREDGDTFYCPAGHPQSFRESEVDRLRKEKKQYQQRLDRQREQTIQMQSERDTAERRRRAAKAVSTKLKRRIAEGKCPACQHVFSDVGAHIAEAHPGFGGGE